ncbi:exosortase F system-associated protein [Antarcticibacterium arcticum]|uniref:Exosortase F system-associated protein n=1 Tax=Antarcticibacterium arcticum TaxID=2585771 RepID=A0A5B8YQG2_9FLAO|nr:exosortase F system-associated protein [Antarcticibacterium arcticum]QED38179.1 exosortase F system-associated protein [Antarcticibacterium arcticum]
MKARYRIVGISLLVGMLVFIRYFEARIFYDPLLEFYHSDYLKDTTPNFETLELLLNVFYRFFLNSIISLAIIYVAFLDKSILKFSFLLYAILFVIAFPVLMFLIFTIENHNFLALFYVRRFFIHPIFVIILLPAFYYYRLNIRQRNKFKSFPHES